MKPYNDIPKTRVYGNILNLMKYQKHVPIVNGQFCGLPERFIMLIICYRAAGFLFSPSRRLILLRHPPTKMALSHEAGRESPRLNGWEKVPRPFLIGVAGGTASGKSSVCAKIMEQLGQAAVESRSRQVCIISQDAFYRNLNPEEHQRAIRGNFNFDHPDAFDTNLMYKTMQDIAANKTVEIPTYDYVTHKREDTGQVLYPADVVLLEGILVFYFPELRDMFHMKLFVDTDPDTRLSRRVLRDIKERGRDLEKILHQYTSLVKPAFEEFCLPTKKYADVIIPRGADNTVAIDLIVQHIQELMRPNRQNRRRYNSESLVGRPH